MYSIELTVVIPRWNNSATKVGRSQCPTTDNAAAKIPQKRRIVSIIWLSVPWRVCCSYYSGGASVGKIDISQNNSK